VAAFEYSPNLPEGQFAQIDEPEKLYCPGLHAKHTSDVVDFITLENFPAAHKGHAVEPLLD
jgi:hypothetical protein